MANYGTVQQAKEKIIDLILEFTINNTDEEIHQATVEMLDILDNELDSSD